MTRSLPELLQSAEAHLYPNYRQPELVMLRGQGVFVWDTSGKRYLDFYAGIAVNALGHAHPRVVRALTEQASLLCHMSNYFYNEPNIELAARLCQLTGFDRVLFSNSGTEANEAMLKLCRSYFHQAGEHDRYRIIAFDGSFHGRTLGALALTGQQKYRQGFGPLPGVTHVPYGDLGAVEAALGPDVAGVIVETVQGEGGVLPAPAGFLEGLRQLTRAHGSLLLIDEIQTGVGRTGRFLGIQHSGVEADAISLAKALGAGVPIGAMLCREKYSEALPPGSHGSTFGGNALASRVALAVLDEFEEKALVSHAHNLGQYLAQRLAKLERQSSVVATTRGQGLLQAVVLDSRIDAREVVGALRDAGLLVTVAGGQALRLSPPLIITEEELDLGLDILERVLGNLS